jgi:hypothetical protein
MKGSVGMKGSSKTAKISDNTVSIHLSTTEQEMRLHESQKDLLDWLNNLESKDTDKESVSQLYHHIR